MIFIVSLINIRKKNIMQTHKYNYHKLIYKNLHIDIHIEEKSTH